MRVKRVLISPELITSLLTSGFHHPETRIIQGLPSGANLVGIGYSAQARAWAADFVHESFDQVIEGAEPPQFVVTYETSNN
jgi:hypothetical protein